MHIKGAATRNLILKVIDAKFGNISIIYNYSSSFANIDDLTEGARIAAVSLIMQHNMLINRYQRQLLIGRSSKGAGSSINLGEPPE